MRDPKKNPKEGDVLQTIGGSGRFPYRQVSDVEARNVCWVSDRTCEVKMRLSSWRTWAKTAEVLHAAE